MGLRSGIRDPGSGKNLFMIPDPGSRGQKGTGSRVRIRNAGIKWRKCRQTGRLHERWLCRVTVHKQVCVERWPRNYLIIISRNGTKFSIWLKFTFKKNWEFSGLGVWGNAIKEIVWNFFCIKGQYFSDNKIIWNRAELQKITYKEIKYLGLYISVNRFWIDV